MQETKIFSINPYTINLFFKAAQHKIDNPIKKMIHRNIKAACTIYVYNDNNEWTGSGFHVGNGYIVTAGHVIPLRLLKEPHEIVVTFDGKLPHKASIVIVEPNYDIAILYSKTIANIVPAAKLANSDNAEIGDTIATISSPEAWHNTATVGIISNIHQSLGEKAPSPAWNDIIFIDADILPGGSGGMVIGTDGLVYGAIMGVTGQLAKIGIGERAVCPSNKIKEVLKKIGLNTL